MDNNTSITAADQETVASIGAGVDAAGPSHAHPSDGSDVLPEIRVNLRVLPAVTREAWEALTSANRRRPHLFTHGGQLVRLERHGGTVVSRELTPQRLHHTLGRVAYWYTARNGDQRPALPPKFVVEDMLACWPTRRRRCHRSND